MLHTLGGHRLGHQHGSLQRSHRLAYRQLLHRPHLLSNEILLSAGCNSGQACRALPAASNTAGSPQQKIIEEQLLDEAIPARAKTPDYHMVTTEEELLSMLEDLKTAKTVAVDCEGVKLGDKQAGKLMLMQISARISQGGKTSLRIWIVDILKLKWKAFQYHTADKTLSLKKLLEDDSVAKLMYDVRSDSVQLYVEYSIKLRAAYDLQLAEVAVRQLQRIPTTFVMPLDKVLTSYLPRTAALQEDMSHSYEVARAYHYTNMTEVWEQRPLSLSLLHYAANDVRYLHQLTDVLNMKLPSAIVDKVKQASTSRVQSPSAPDKRRAEAPVIVRHRDLLQLLNNRQELAQPTGDSDVPGSGSPAHKTMNGVDKLHLPSSSSVSSSNKSEKSDSFQRRSQRSEPGADSGTAAAAAQPAAPRALPPRLPSMLPVGQGSDSGVGPGARTGAAGPGLLQPRKRAEGEEVPSWVYDHLKPKSSSESEEAGEGDDGDGVTQAEGEQEELVPDQAEQKEEEEVAVVKNNLLLWDGQAQAGSGRAGGGVPNPAASQLPKLQRPSVRRP